MGRLAQVETLTFNTIETEDSKTVDKKDNPESDAVTEQEDTKSVVVSEAHERAEVFKRAVTVPGLYGFGSESGAPLIKFKDGGQPVVVANHWGGDQATLLAQDTKHWILCKDEERKSKTTPLTIISLGSGKSFTFGSLGLEKP